MRARSIARGVRVAGDVTHPANGGRLCAKGTALGETLIPQIAWRPDYVGMLVAVLGTTISPYLFFWQASQEVEEQRATPGHEPLRAAPEQARAHLARIKFDTYLGMLFSNLIAFCIMLTTAATLHASGVTQIGDAAQAAAALRPLAGDFAFALFALGIIGTGLLAIPVLAGSGAYAVAELFGWPSTLEAKFPEAVGFYTIISAATVIGFAVGFLPINPIQLLVWTAVINGIVAAPIMAVMMLIAACAPGPGVLGPLPPGARTLI